MKKYTFAFHIAYNLVLVYTIPAGAATFTYSYDSLNRLTNATYSDGSGESYLYDQAGNRILRTTIGATNHLDNTPPSIPSNLVYTAFSPSQLSITWNRSFDTEVQEIAMRLLRFFGILTKGDAGSVDASKLPR